MQCRRLASSILGSTSAASLTAGSSSGSFTYPQDPDDDPDTIAASLGLGGTTSHEFTIRQEDG
jgi:hypothetical protein